MNRHKDNYIGLNQNIPFKVLDAGLYRLLLTGGDKNEIQKDMFEVTAGKNRAEKAASFTNQILTRPEKAIQYIKSNFTANDYLELPIRERKALISSLIALTYPIFYNFLALMGMAFKLQREISRSYINQKLAAQYGSNRTLDIAIDAIIPMAIDLNVIKRIRIAFYEAVPPQVILNPIIAEIYIYADITCSGTKSLLKDDLSTRALYSYYKPQTFKPGQGGLLKFTNGIIGGGYIELYV